MALLTSLLRWVGVIVYRLGLFPVVYRWNGQGPRVVVYHACVPSEDDFVRDLQSNTTPEELERHLAFYRRHYRIAALTELPAGTRTMTITFDDGYRSVYTNALPVLQRHSTPATVYLIADVVGNAGLVWVNELNWQLHRHPTVTLRSVTQHFGAPDGNRPRDVVIHVQQRYDRHKIRLVLSEIREATGIDPRALAAKSRLYLDWDEIDEMRNKGIAFGSHTASHPNLKRLNPDDQRREMQAAREKLASRLGAVTSLAYPFGYHGPETATIAADVGHETMVEIGGTNRSFDPHRVARIPVIGRTDAQLFAEIEVVEPLKAWLKRAGSRR